MMYGFLAFAMMIHYLNTLAEKAKAIEPISLISKSDYTLTWDEIDFYRNEIDRIELRIQEIEDDLRIKDSISHLRNISYTKELKFLYNEIDRHNLRLEELEY